MDAYNEKKLITLIDLIDLLSNVFPQTDSITGDTEIMKICSNDLNRMQTICKKIEDTFGVKISFSDIQFINTVDDLLKSILNKQEHPDVKYLSTARDTRRQDLYDIVSKGKLDDLNSSLSNARKQLDSGLKGIKNCSVPLDKIGYQFKNEFFKKLFNNIDYKASRKELIDVVTVVDANTKTGFGNISAAIQATNKCIDAIGKLIFMVIQVEKDLYDTADETSGNISMLGEELFKDGINIDGLSRIAEREREKRLKIQAKIQDFKADVYGKIDFLNKVNQNIHTEFIDYQNKLDTAFDTANEQLNAYIEKAKTTINSALLKQDETLQELKDKYTYLEKELLKKFKDTESDFCAKIDNAQEKLYQQIHDSIEKQNESLLLMKADINNTLSEWNKEKESIEKKNKNITLVVVIVAIFEIIFTLFFL